MSHLSKIGTRSLRIFKFIENSAIFSRRTEIPAIPSSKMTKIQDNVGIELTVGGIQLRLVRGQTIEDNLIFYGRSALRVIHRQSVVCPRTVVEKRVIGCQRLGLVRFGTSASYQYGIHRAADHGQLSNIPVD